MTYVGLLPFAMGSTKVGSRFAVPYFGRFLETNVRLYSVDGAGRWYFASGAASGKGRDLAVNPHAALSFWWPGQGRQIRIRGAVIPAGAQASAADFLGRPPASRAEALTGRQSEPLDDLAELDRAFKQAQARVSADPGLVAPDWTLYALTADEVEFWQGDPDRRHVRLRYRRAGDAALQNAGEKIDAAQLAERAGAGGLVLPFDDAPTRRNRLSIHAGLPQ